MNESLKKFLETISDYLKEKIVPKIDFLVLKDSKPKFDGINSFRSGKKNVLTIKNQSKDELNKLQVLYETYFEIKNLILRLAFNTLLEFSDFDILSKYLEFFKINGNESLEIISWLVSKNLENVEKYKESEYAPLMVDFVFSFKKMNSMSLDEMIKLNSYLEQLQDYPEEHEKLKQARDSLFDRNGNATVGNVATFISINEKFKKHYLDKKDSFDKSDIDEIVSSLTDLGISKQIIVPIKVILQKEVEKRLLSKKSDIDGIINAVSKLGIKEELVSAIKFILIKETENKEEFDDIFEMEDLLVKLNLPEQITSLIKPILEKNRSVKDYILDSSKKTSIDNIEDSILKLGVSKEVVFLIKIILKVEIQKDSKSEEKTSIITEAEYKKVTKELRRYFDFHRMKKIRDLSIDDILYCIGLLIKIDKLAVIKEFITASKKGEHPITLYIELYDRLKYYQYDTKYLEDCFNSMFICDTEDYEFYRSEMQTELEKILESLPQMCECEINEKGKKIKFEK